MIVAGDDGEILTDGGQDFQIDEQPAFRLESNWTDEETAHELLELLVDAGVRRDALKIVERRLEVDTGP